MFLFNSLFNSIQQNPLDALLKMLRAIGIFCLAAAATFAVFYAAVFIIPSIFMAVVGAVGGFVPHFFSGYISTAFSAGFAGASAGLASGYWFSKLIAAPLFYAAVNTSIIVGGAVSIWNFFKNPGFFAGQPIALNNPEQIQLNNPLQNLQAQPGVQPGNAPAPDAAAPAPQQGVNYQQMNPLLNQQPAQAQQPAANHQGQAPVAPGAPTAQNAAQAVAVPAAAQTVAQQAITPPGQAAANPWQNQTAQQQNFWAQPATTAQALAQPVWPPGQAPAATNNELAQSAATNR